MDQNEYPRPQYAAGPYPKDKSWGIAIIVFSVLGICLGGLATAGGGIMSAAGVTGAAAGAANGAGREANEAATAATVGGGAIMAIGIGLVLLSIVRLVGGIGILKGQKWGFLVTAVVSGLLILLNLASLPSGIISIVISGIILYYCVQRITGKEGPTPV